MFVTFVTNKQRTARESFLAPNWLNDQKSFFQRWNTELLIFFQVSQFRKGVFLTIIFNALVCKSTAFHAEGNGKKSFMSLNTTSHYYSASKSRLGFPKEQNTVLPIFLSLWFVQLHRVFLSSRLVGFFTPVVHHTGPGISSSAKQRKPITSLLKPAHVKWIGVCKQIKMVNGVPKPRQSAHIPFKY